MSEKIFALLLRLYPASFRAQYGDESLQLLRDRLRDETGILARLRLVFDLFTDTAVALPRVHRTPAPALSAAAASGLPSFAPLEPQSMRPAALVLAWIIGFTGLVTFGVMLRYAGINHASRLAIVEQRAAAQRRWTNGGFLGTPDPPPPPPPSYDMLQTPPDTPPATPLPQPTGVSPSPAPATRSAPATKPTPIPGHTANSPQTRQAQPPTPIIMVPVLPGVHPPDAIPLPALEKQFGVVPLPARQSPSYAAPAQPFAKPTGRRSIVVMNPTAELPPCPSTTSETGSNSSINPASSAASAQKSHPCSKLPRSPTASASPASTVAPK